MNLTFDLNKVKYASLYWVNQEYNITSAKEPKRPTVRGCAVEDAYAYPLNLAYPKETLFERAKRLDILDVWTLLLELHFTKNHVVEVKGKRALSLWKAYSALIFKRKK